jgi:hypothetical protein
MNKLFLVLMLFIFPVLGGCLLGSEDDNTYVYGYVTNKNEFGIYYVSISLILKGTIIASTYTNSYGYYEFDYINNGTYTVIPSKIGFTFTPSSVNIVVKGSDKKVEVQTIVGKT